MTRQCHACKNLYWQRLDRGRCAAFPDGIPDELWLDRVSHQRALSGDHGVIHVRLENEERGRAIESRHDAWARAYVVELPRPEDPLGAAVRDWSQSADAIAMAGSLLSSGHGQELAQALHLVQEILDAEGCDYLDAKGWLGVGLGLVQAGQELEVGNHAGALAHLAGPFRDSYVTVRMWHTLAECIRRIHPSPPVLNAETARLPDTPHYAVRESRVGLGEIELFEPWVPVADGRELEAELRREVSASHVLREKRLFARARRSDNDVLFISQSDLFVVHLTWSRKPEVDASYPATQSYFSLHDFVVRRAFADYAEHTGRAWDGTADATGVLLLDAEPAPHLLSDLALSFGSALDLDAMSSALMAGPGLWSLGESSFYGKYLTGRGSDFRARIITSESGFVLGVRAIGRRSEPLANLANGILLVLRAGDVEPADDFE